MVYYVAFNRNANSSKNRVTCSWFKFPMETTLKKIANITLLKHSQLCSLGEKLVLTVIRTREDGSPGLSWW